MEKEFLGAADTVRWRTVSAAVIVGGGLVVLLCVMRLSAPRTPLGLLALLLLVLAAETYPLTGEDVGDLPDPELLPLISSTPLLAAIALYGTPWATVMAALARALGGVLLVWRRQRRRRPQLRPMPWLRDVAGGAVATALAGTLYGLVAGDGTLSSPDPALPALFVAEAALICSAWGLAALRVVARRETLGARARWGALEALPALASEPALAFVLAGAVATGRPLAMLMAALPAAALVGSLRWHTAMRRRLEQAHARLEVQAATDPLTGLANRGLFQRMLEARLAESARYDRPLAVLLIDLDGFKGINDAYGHACGDKVLVAVAGALRRELRGSDLAARLGGDEFVALLPETDTGRALALAERACAEIAGIEVAAGLATVRPTVSVGVAATTDDAHADSAALLAAADRAAYAAKHAGKNRAHLAA